MADIILPGAAYTEKTATFVNMEGRAQETKYVHYTNTSKLFYKSFVTILTLSRPFLHPKNSFISNIPSSRLFLHPEHSFIPNISSSRTFLHPKYSFIQNIPSSPLGIYVELFHLSLYIRLSLC